MLTRHLPAGRPPAAAGVLLLSACAGVASTVIRHPPNSVGYRFVVDFFWLTLLFAVAANAIVVLLLPRRQIRTFGKRQVDFPLARMGQLLIAAAFALFALAMSLPLAGTLTLPQLRGVLRRR